MTECKQVNKCDLLYVKVQNVLLIRHKYVRFTCNKPILIKTRNLAFLTLVLWVLGTWYSFTREKAIVILPLMSGLACRVKCAKWFVISRVAPNLPAYMAVSTCFLENSNPSTVNKCWCATLRHQSTMLILAPKYIGMSWHLTMAWAISAQHLAAMREHTQNSAPTPPSFPGEHILITRRLANPTHHARLITASGIYIASY